MNSLASLLPSRRYALPDKAVASQVLMYRQLLHTECKPGLRLSRGYEGTDAQNKVKHMPWWEQGVEKTKRMVISYDNLIVRLWLNGAIMPFVDGGYAEQHSEISVPKDDCNSINENQDQSLEGQEVKVKVPATDDIDQASKGENSENKHTTKPENNCPPRENRQFFK